MEFKEAADALKALQTPDLLLSGKRLVIKPRHARRQGKPPQSPEAESASKRVAGATPHSQCSAEKRLEDLLGVEGSGEILQMPEVSMTSFI